MLISITVPGGNLRGPQYMEQVLAAIHQANPRRLPVTLSYASYRATVRLLCAVPSHLASVALAHLGAHYPDATIERLDDTTLTPLSGHHVLFVDLRLAPDIFPLRRYTQFEDPLNRTTADPLAGIFAALMPGLPDDCTARIDVMVRPAPSHRVRQARRALRTLSRPFFTAHPSLARAYALAATSPSPALRHTITAVTAVTVGHAAAVRAPNASSSRTHDREEDLQAAMDKVGRHLFEAHLRLTVAAPPASLLRAREKLAWLTSALGPFTSPHLASFRPSAPGYARYEPPLPCGRGFLLSCEELATLWHPATATVRAPAMKVTESRELEPPVSLPTTTSAAGLASLGVTKYRSRRMVFGIRPDDRRRHLAVIGKTGMGKTTLLHRLIASDMLAGQGLALIDPHGDLADAVLNCVPRNRTNDAIVFDAGDRDYPLAFNPLQCRNPLHRPLVASGVLSAFKKLYGDSWGPRLEHILRNALLTLLEVPGSSLLSLQRLLSDSGYRAMAVGRLSDPVVKGFWQHEFSAWKPQYQAEAVAPIQNKVGQFLSHPILRAIVGQTRRSLDLRSVMDSGSILIANLSKGKIGEDGSTLLGSLLVTGIQAAAMGRADLPESQRRDFHLYVDEFQNFATDSFATILSEARKYRLTLTIANQYLAQMDDGTREAVFGNVGSLLTFQVGASDAETLAAQLGADVTPQDLLALPRFTAYARLLIDGMPSRPFSMETLPSPPPRAAPNRSDIVRRTSRHRFAQPAKLVSAEIARGFGDHT